MNMKLLPTLRTLAAILAKYFILKLFFKYFKLFLKVSKLKPEQSLGKVRVQFFFLRIKALTVHSDYCIKDVILVLFDKRQIYIKTRFINQYGGLYAPYFIMLKDHHFLQFITA